MNFTDRQVILTGATGGIGRAVAQQLAERGARVIAIGRHQQTLRDLEHQLPKPATDHHVFFSADITDSSERLRVFKTLHQQQLRPNCLITLAGVNDFAMFKDQAADTIQNIIDLNVSASLFTTQMAIPLIRHEKNPLIVHVGSVFGALGYPGQSVYCASKYALRGFSEALRRELSDTPITVKYFAPRATQTAFNSSSMRQLNHTLGNTVDAPETVARALLKFMHTTRSEYTMGYAERIFVLLNQLLPGLISRALKKQMPLIRQHATARSSTVNYHKLSQKLSQKLSHKLSHKLSDKPSHKHLSQASKTSDQKPC